jgi:hypothetical protein
MLIYKISLKGFVDSLQLVDDPDDILSVLGNFDEGGSDAFDHLCPDKLSFRGI